MDEQWATSRQTGDCRWKLTSHAIGGSVFLQPYAVGLSGIVIFCLVVMMEAYVTGNSLILLRKMTPQGNDEKVSMERGNYFTIVANHLGGGRRGYRVVVAVFVVEVVVCSSFYFKAVSEVVFSTWLVDSTRVERISYHFWICVAISIFLIVTEYASEKIAKLWYGTDDRRASSVNFIANEIGTVNISGSDEDSSHDGKSDNSIDMPAVLERMYGYRLRRFWLLLIFSFSAAFTIVLYVELSSSDVAMINTTSLCPGLLNPQYFVWPNVEMVITFPIVTFSLMQYAIFLPICCNELKQPISDYTSCVRQSSVVFIIVYCSGAILISFIFGSSAPSLFPTEFGTNQYGHTLKVLALLFILEAVLLRIMACCRLIQVLFDFKSGVSYWQTAAVLFVTCYLTSNWTPSVLHFAIIAGCGTSNLLLIILPWIAYLRFVKKSKSSLNDSLTTDGQDSSQLSGDVVDGESNETIEDPGIGLWEIVQTVICIGLHSLLLLVMIPSLMTVDVDIGNECHTVFDKLWSSDKNQDERCR